MNEFQGKKVLVVGLARSGAAAARLLRGEGAEVSVTEKNRTPALEALAGTLQALGVAVELGGHGRESLEGKELVVVSPGVRLDSSPVVRAREAGIEVISEIELAASLCPATIIAITGTNGKTTTTTLVGEVLRAAGKKAYVLGNIGRPFSEFVPEMRKGDFVSLEVSSFQLETIKNFHPRVSVILNVTPDHLDRYKDVAQYFEAKKRIYMNQGAEDFLVLNYGDRALAALEGVVRPRVVFFNKDDGERAFDQNQMAVVAVAGALGIERRVCEKVFGDFRGVEHRLEFVRDLDGITFINDSKATNIDSTIWALKNIKRPAVLIAGGRDKGSDFGSLVDLVKEKVKAVVLVGEASDRIAAAWEGAVPMVRVQTYEEAIRAALRRAARGDCVLLSPMCKSFDLFTDYEHRGRVFKEIVNKL